MLILILINVQYLEKAVFSFKIGSTGQKYSSSGYHHPIKKFPAPKFLISPTTTTPPPPPPPCIIYEC